MKSLKSAFRAGTGSPHLQPYTRYIEFERSCNSVALRKVPPLTAVNPENIVAVNKILE